MRLGGLYPMEAPERSAVGTGAKNSDAQAKLRFVLPESVDDFDDIVAQLDRYGLSTIGTPRGIENWTSDDCVAFGERARELGIVVGEGSFGGNLMSADGQLVDQRIEALRKALQSADLVQSSTHHILVGTKDSSDSLLAPHPYKFTDEAKAELREATLRVMDGLDLQHTRLLIEPYNNSFYYQPEDIREFLDSVGHPMVGLQLDIVNMIAFDTIYDTTSLINRTFDLLSDYIHAAHIKDMHWAPGHLILKWDEVLIGQGVLDLKTYLQRLGELDPDLPCYCEHLPDEESYAHNFARIHEAAGEAGLSFVARS